MVRKRKESHSSTATSTPFYYTKSLTLTNTRKEDSQGSNNKKICGRFRHCNRLMESSGSCFKDQVEWCLGSSTEL